MCSASSFRNAYSFALGGPEICDGNSVKERPNVDHEPDQTLLFYMLLILNLN